MSQAADPGLLLRAILSGPDVDYDTIVAPDAVLSPFMKPKGYVGPDGARQYWRDAAKQGLEVRVRITSVEVAGHRAIAFGELQASGRVADVRTLAWGCRVEGGLIVEFCAFPEPEAAEDWLLR